METTSPNHRTGWLMAAVAWLVMLLVSDLPNILLNLSQGEPDWLFLTKAGVLVVFLCVTLFVPKLRLLWQVAVIFLAFLLIRRASAWLGGTALWQNWFGQGVLSRAPWLAVARFFGNDRHDCRHPGCPQAAICLLSCQRSAGCTASTRALAGDRVW